MSRNSTRLALAITAVFYAVAGGLWATNYFPLRHLYTETRAREAVMESFIEKFGVEKWATTPETVDPEAVAAWKKHDAYVTKYALNYPAIDVVEARIALYETILLWGTVALAVGGAVLLLTRGKPKGKRSIAPGDAA